jgi:uridine phosphorylase
LPLHPDDARQPILGVRASQLAPRALVVGDPDRVPAVAEHLDDVEEVGRSREYVTVTGRFDGVTVTVASHGVGASGAAICFEELCRAGVTTIVRAGTAGGLQPTIGAGSLVVGTAAVRDDGLTDRLVDPGWPAVADAGLTIALDRAARDRGLAVHTGVVHTAANFYPSPSGDDPRWTIFRRAGALAIEMEFAALLVVASLHGVRAGGIFAVDGNLGQAASDMADYDPDTDIVARAKDAMLDAALLALVATVS